MPFASDKQRRYLWSQKPEVAKQIAYKNRGGPLGSSQVPHDDDLASANRRAGSDAIQKRLKNPSLRERSGYRKFKKRFLDEYNRGYEDFHNAREAAEAKYKKTGSAEAWDDWQRAQRVEDAHARSEGFAVNQMMDKTDAELYNEALNYEDPILLNELKNQMADRKKRFEDWGIKVEHEYGDPNAPRYQRDLYDPRKHGVSPGEWHARTGDMVDGKWQPGLAVNIPYTPSLANALVGEEEYSHVLGAWDRDREQKGPTIEAKYGPKGSDDTLYEEMRAKQEAVRNIGGRLTPDVRRAFDQTLNSYYQGNHRDRMNANVGPLGADRFWKLYREAEKQPGRNNFYNAKTGRFSPTENRRHWWRPFSE